MWQVVRDRRALGAAWIALAVALAVHVADEAAHGFLSVYNPIARAVRETVPVLVLPTFSFRVWLGGLIAGVAVLLVLSPLAFRRREWIRRLSDVLGGIMIANGLLHFAGTAVLGRPMPGVYSSPLLVAAAAYLILAAHHARTSRAGEAPEADA